MPDDGFGEPQVALHRIYTRQGDTGTTRLVNGRAVRKDDPRVEAYGTVDELGAFVGRARASLTVAAADCPQLEPLVATLRRIQHELFNLGSEIATDPGLLGERQPRIRATEIERLEADIDEKNRALSPLRSFVLAGEPAWNADLHVCRTVCRRAERTAVALAASEPGLDLAVQYLNRLSDAFFVWTRWACLQMGQDETLWEPNAPENR